MESVRTKYIVHGFVQGVGYRAYVKGVADTLGVNGEIENLDDGSVAITAEAEKGVLDEFEKRLNISMKYGIKVLNIEKQLGEDEKMGSAVESFEGFKIVK